MRRLCSRFLRRPTCHSPAIPGRFPLRQVPARWHSGDEAPKSVQSATLIYPQSPTSQHTDLASFLEYAQRNNVDEKSTVYVGTYYEYLVAAALSQYGFSLTRIGGASDLGIDLVGTWTPPTANLTMKVVIQAKAGSQSMKPTWVRELEGASVGAPTGWKGKDVMGFVVSERPATKGTREALKRSRTPMGFICCSKDGRVLQMLWNSKAELEGLSGFSVVAKHNERDGEEHLVLLRAGEPLPLLQKAPE